MKKQSIKVIALLAVAGTFATGCDLLKDLEYTVTPDPLEMHGDSVRVKVDVTIPEKGINKKAAADITPMLGNTALKSIRIQGEKATGNGEVVAKAGGKVTYTDIVAYTPDMEATDLMVTGKVFKGEKEKEEITPTKIADATIITPYLVNKDFKVVIAKDEFKRVTEETFVAQLNYAKGQSTVSSSEMRQDDIKAYQAFLEKAQADPKVALKSVNVTGFASPEGEEDKNNSLSTDRAASGKTSAMKVAKSAKNETAEGEIYNETGSGEDYEGFKAELSADTKMNEDDKNLVLRVLETISNPAEREKAMRDMGKTFNYLDKNIFPQLRRSEIVAVYDQTGFSDEELMALSTSNPDTLNLEELLFTAQLYTDLNEQLRVYKIAETRFPDDYRTSNNVGAVLYMQNKMSEAKSQFEKANGVQDNVISKNNLGAIAGVEGDRTKAAELLDQANGAGEEVNYNKGILDIQNGDYAEAVSNLGSDASYNKALAQLLNGNAASAVSTLDNSDDAETAQGYYLKAVAAARQDKLQDIVSNLTNAFAKDGSLKAKAAKDREFLKYMENASFSAIVK
ncbi:MAG: tetratricopeptide repeat protein [Crocinitomicaceae bacterium]